MANPELFILPWQDQDDYETPEPVDDTRIACTLDIRSELTRVKPDSWEEYLLCYEAAYKPEGPLSERERYLIARYGKEYAANPDKFNEKLDDIENRMKDHVGDFVLIQKSPTQVSIEKLSSPTLEYFIKIGGFGFPYVVLLARSSSSIFQIVDRQFKIVPELTRDFVDIHPEGKSFIAEGSTRPNWIDDGKGGLVLDPEKPSYHEGDEYTVCFGLDEIRAWQRQNLGWAPHIDHMIQAWNTQLVNVHASVAKENSLDGNSIQLMKSRGQDVSYLEMLAKQIKSE